MKARFFLADPSLVRYSGHCFGYLAALAPGARAHGYEPVYLGNRNADEAMRAGHGVVPAFSHWCDARFGDWLHTRHVHETALRDELLEASERFGITSRDVVLLNTLRHWALRGVPDWLDALPPDRRPPVVIVLHFTAFSNPETSDGTVELYREAFERIATSPSRDNILLLADAEELIDEYTATYPGLKFHLAPIPHVPPEGPRLPRKPGEPVRAGYVGEARMNKGFHLLPWLAHRMAASGAERAAELHVHSFIGQPREEFYRRALAGLRYPFVTLYPHQMNDAEYEHFLASLDLVLIPYTPENYHAQTSGIFAEAMAHGQSVVAPKGTWMARQLAIYGGGGAFNPGDGEDFAAVTLGVIRDRAKFEAGAAARAARWRAFHHPERFLDMVWAFAGRSRATLAAAA